MAARATSASLRGLEIDGAIAQDRVILFLDRVQDFLAAAAEKFEIDGEFAIDFRDQWEALRNQSWARSTSNFIIERKAGVFWLRAMSFSLTLKSVRSSSGR